jgi:hypothetical protein
MSTNLISDYTELQDGLIVITQQGNVILDARFVSDGSASLYVVDTYKRISDWPGEIMNVTYLVEYAHEDYEQSGTVTFEDRDSMMKFLGEQMLLNHF